MISSLSGVIRLKNPTQVVIEAAGVGFELAVPLSTSHVLPEVGNQGALFVQSVFNNRSGMALYGFATQEEKAVFNRLTDIKGIGPKAALHMLSRFSPAEILAILSEQKIETLKTVPGIGPKRAALILGRLKADIQPELAPDPQLESAISALLSLGLTRSEAMNRLDQIPDRAGRPLNEILMLALKCKD